MNNNYYIGLDLGTDSLGWATTNEDYDFLRLKGKTAWGSRIFSSANDCKQRRTFRSSRRRMQRRKYRIYLLNQLLCEDISKVDSTFFARLQNSHMVWDDKKKLNLSRNLIFKDKNEEKLFYKKYPTIWHLRNALINKDTNALSDIRYVYLALHHIIKYRGNFLKEGKLNIQEFNFSLFSDLNDIIKEYIEEKNEIDVDFDIISKDSYQKIINIIENDNTNKTEKKKELKELFNSSYSKEVIDCFITLSIGGEYDISKLSGEDSLKVSFEKNYDEIEASIQSSLQNYFKIVQIAKQLYDYNLLKKLIGNSKSISEVMVNVYKTHKQDLTLLKKVINNIDKQNGNHTLYEEVFKDKNNNKNYASLVHNNTETNRVSLSDFNAYIGKILDSNKDKIEQNDYNYLKNKVEKKELLQIIANVSTSIIPHQLHYLELETILDNASELYPSIKENKDKFIKLFLFRVPYYFGPLDSRSKNSNVVRKENTTVTPWNIDSIIDYSQTKEKFMKKLTNNCSYLYACSVLPSASLIIEDYQIYNRLNVLTINGALINNELKENLYKYIIGRNKTTVNSLKTYLKNKEGFKGEILFDKIKEDVPFEASSHAILGKAFDLDKDLKLLERCILLATIYIDDKKAFIDEVTLEFPNLTKEQLNCIKNIVPKKWSRLSKELLTELYYVDDNGIAYSILTLLKDTNKNLQMILFDKQYNFMDLIKEKNDEMSGNKSTSDVINEMLEQVPAITRRCINQTMLVVDDIIKAAKKEPSKIMMEVTRNESNDKKEKNSRYKELENFLNSIIKDSKNSDSEYKNQATKLNNELHDEHLVDNFKLKGKHLFLYFKQLGIDMYTGEIINIHDVLNSNKYDTDHIIPQSLIKDDSLDNLVLVSRTINQNVKKDYYPIPQEIKTDKVKSLWTYLFKRKLISEKKYNNLVRSKEISYDEIEQFVNRQINVIDYANITIKNIMEKKYPNTQIIFSKSHYPSFLRKELKIVKNRNVNDAHHAVDAYLNVVCGNILSTKFSNIRKIYELKNNPNREKNTTFNMENVLLFELESKKLFDKIKANCFRHDALVTFKTDYNNGALYKQTMFKASNDESLIPIHTNNEFNDTTKYGGYSSLSSSRMTLVTYSKKSKKYKYIITRKSLFDKQNLSESEYLKKILDDVDNPQIICDICLNQKIIYDGGIYLLYTSDSTRNKLKMAYQNYIDNNILYYLDKANKLSADSLKDDTITYDYLNKNGEVVLQISKDMNKKIFNTLIETAKKPVYDSCNYIKRIRDLSNFETFNIKSQIEILNNIILTLSRNSEKSKLDNYYKEVGNALLRVSKDVTKNNITLLYESPTGLFVTKRKI